MLLKEKGEGSMSGNQESGQQRRISVYPLPFLAEPSALSETAAVVIDVLRATTVLTRAVHSGVREIIPVLDITTALHLKRNYPPAEVLLGGERHGLPMMGFDLGNSPQDYTPERVSGKTLILTTTNGTVAMHAARFARSIYIASFLNANAVLKHLQHENDISILCAGTDGTETEEDLLLAGCLTARLTAHRHFQLNEAAQRAAGLWRESIGVVELEKWLRESLGGQNLLRLGLEADIAVSAQLDTVNIVPQRDPERSALVITADR